jgi:predicted acylesterase/phospholipase RssA
MYETLILSGGGTKGLCSLGSLQYLQDSKRLDCSKIKTMVGTSIGAVICYFLAIGYTPIELVVYLCSHSVLEALTINHFNKIVSGEGIYDYQLLKTVYEKMTMEKMNHIPTLQEVYTLFGKDLIICTYNFTDRKQEHLSYRTHPDLSCLDAIRMSSNLPFIFSSFWYKEKEYIDGGVIENFAFSIVKDIAAGTGVVSNDRSNEPDQPNEKKIVGIYLDVESHSKKQEKQYNQITSVLDKMYDMLMIPSSFHEKQRVASLDHRTIDLITVVSHNIKIYTFHLPHSDKLELFSLGYNKAKEYFM